MKWLKKWFYLILLAGMGCIYLSSVDKWQVYAEPLMQVKAWYNDLGAGEGALAAGSSRTQTGEGSDLTAGEEGQENSGVSFDDNGGNAEGAIGEENSSGGDVEGAIGEENSPGGNAGGAIGEENSPGGDVGETIGEGNSLDGDAEGALGEGVSGGEDAKAPDVIEWFYTDVEDDYFADAVFIGDSRTVSMFEYGGLEEISTFYASTGLTVYKMFDAEIVTVPGEKKKISVEEALQQNSFGKIYLMIGINEMGTGTVESFMEAYQEAVEHLQELQPNAIIYLQGIMKVTTQRSNQGDYIHNEGIVARNEAIEQLADNKKIFYLDVNPFICDENGGLEASYTFDGVHLKAKYVYIWKDYLKSHAIDFGDGE